MRIYIPQFVDMPQEYKLILQYADEPGYTPDIECYLRHGGYEALEKAFALQPKDLAGRQKTFRPGANPSGSHDLRPARARRRGFFLRPEMVASSTARAASRFT